MARAACDSIPFDLGKEILEVFVLYAFFRFYIKNEIKVIKPKNPKSKNHLQFQGGVRYLQAFYRNLQMIMNESLEESLKPQEEKISKVFKTKNPVEIKGIDRLIDMSSIGVVQSMQKQNPRGFKTVSYTHLTLPTILRV